MQWYWRYEKDDGGRARADEVPMETFTTQSDAETWLGENWRTLREAGVDQVTLFEGDEECYGPMSLNDAQ